MILFVLIISLMIFGSERVENLFFHFYFLNKDISLDIEDTNIRSWMCLNNIFIQISHFFI